MKRKDKIWIFPNKKMGTVTVCCGQKTFPMLWMGKLFLRIARFCCVRFYFYHSSNDRVDLHPIGSQSGLFKSRPVADSLGKSRQLTNHCFHRHWQRLVERSLCLRSFYEEMEGLKIGLARILGFIAATKEEPSISKLKISVPSGKNQP